MLQNLKIWFEKKCPALPVLGKKPRTRRVETFRTRRAETLVEVVMALFIVAVGATASTNLIVSALQANSFSRDNLIALNLAVEGLEAMRNIRDTNWLKFGSDKEHCWNMLPEETVCDGVVAKLIQRGNYSVDLNPKNMMWTLTNKVDWLDLNDQPKMADYQLKFVDMSKGKDQKDLYISQNSITNFGNQVSSSGDSKFYRMIGVTYEPTPLPENSDAPEKSQEMAVTALVQWKDGAAVHQVQLYTKLSNYQKPKPQQ